MEENRIATFIDNRIEQMLSRPGVWGGSFCVEACILSLLEVRDVALYGDSSSLNREFTKFLIETVGVSGVSPLSFELEQTNRSNEFASFLRQFVSQHIKNHPTSPQ